MRPRRILAIALCTAGVLAGFAASAPAAVIPAPAWSVSSISVPTNFQPGDTKHDYFYEVALTNSGGLVTDGSKLVFTDTLPEGLGVKSVAFELRKEPASYADFASSACETTKVGEVNTVTCEVTEGIPGTLEAARLLPNEHLLLTIHVSVPPSASGPLVNHVVAEGGGALPASGGTENEATTEPAPPGFSEFSSELNGGDGEPAALSGSHPFAFTTTFAVNTKFGANGKSILAAGGDIKDIEVKLPPGLIGNPTAIDRCTPKQFITVHVFSPEPGRNYFPNECPNSSVIGVLSLRQLEGKQNNAGVGGGPLYNLVPPKGMPAQFGFSAGGGPFYLDTELRSGDDYGVTVHLRNTSEAVRITAASVTVWGVPADEAHDPVRGVCAEAGSTCSADVLPPVPFLRLPTSCENQLPFVMNFDSWTEPGLLFAGTDTEEAPIGCNQPEFEPTVETHPTTNVADSPTGLQFNLHIPQKEQEEDPEGRGEADLRDATVTLPEGLLVNPASAAGRTSCSAAQIGFKGIEGGTPHFTPGPANCPDSSKVGSVEVETPLVDHPLPGAVYLAKQGENPFNSLIALYVAVYDPQTGVVVKLAGKVSPDPSTGRITATFEDNPQTPFEDFKFDFFEGARAPLRTPPSCGSYAVSTDLKPWTAPESGPDVNLSETFKISDGPAGGCPSGGLAPKLSTGLQVPTAGTYSPFSLQLTRADATGVFTALNATPPLGLLAKLKDIPYCSEAAIAQAVARSQPGQGAVELASPSCPAASQVGTAAAGAGAGPSPIYVSGNVYLAGPYKGAPISLVAMIPAVAGPFDLGVVSDRIAVHVDPETAQVRTQSDPFPTILSGIPVDVRDIRVNLDRSNFTLAPTSCEPKTVEATVFGVAGATAALSERFQVGGCDRLRFGPKLSLQLKGGTKHGEFPALHAVLTAKTGEANIAGTSVALPHSEFLEQAHLGTICTRVQFAARACPKKSVYGKARAFSPLLDKPLEGPVYLRANGGERPLPDLVAALRGQLEVDLVGHIDSHSAGIRTTFESVPDAPVSKFVLDLKGKDKGLLVNSRNICAQTNRATVKMTAQNGKLHNFRPVLKASCKTPRKRRR